MRIHVGLVIVEGIPAAWLDDTAAVEAALMKGVEAASFTLLGRSAHAFTPQGVTAIAIVGESHVAIHTWPQEGRLFIDVASCTTAESVDRAILAIVAAAPSGRIVERNDRSLGTID